MEDHEYQISENGIDLAKRHEGFRAKAYLDPVGIPTIGYGLTRYFHREGAPLVRMGDIITRDEASFSLGMVMQDFFDQVARQIRVPLSQNQVDAIASFVYNIGPSAFLKSTCLRMLNDGDYAGAAAQFLRWDKAGGRALPGLTKRRREESELFLEPDYE